MDQAIQTTMEDYVGENLDEMNPDCEAELSNGLGDDEDE